ncbi:13773_t:CDS:1, partial [Gigaspora rosea]
DGNDHKSSLNGDSKINFQVVGDKENLMRSDENNKKRKIDDNNYQPQLSSEYDKPGYITDNAADGFQVSENAVQPFLPFFQTVTAIVNSIMKAYKNGRCNQKICLAIVDRVELLSMQSNLYKDIKWKTKNFLENKIIIT